MLPFRSGRSWKRGASAVFFALVFLDLAGLAAEPKSTPGGASPKPKNPLAAGGVPLPIGHEAKGLVLPDYNEKGQLTARFEAAMAKRIDADRVQFHGLKMTTYTPENTVDVSVTMPSSTLDLNTRIITSHERTTVTRSDFQVAGDNVTFDTVARHGTLVGNVKMTISDQSQFIGKRGE